MAKKFKPSKTLKKLQDIFIIDEGSDEQLDFANEATQYIEHLEKTLSTNNISIPTFVFVIDNEDDDEEV